MKVNISDFIVNNSKLGNMCFTLGRLQSARDQEPEFLTTDNFTYNPKINNYNERIDELLYDIFNLLFEELEIENNINDLRDVDNNIDDAFANVLFEDGDIMVLFKNIETRLAS
ncbi:hypothetical protein [Bacillus fungorum]|uniref:hypothetical protein n=1 Tax=Bacillus fungorum TaxID=2039284 RepID=UPI003F5659C1